jgi:ubiquitin carboxyl-terminal hydrolase L3
MLLFLNPYFYFYSVISKLFAQKMQEKEDNWMPLESNPEVINSYVRDLGFDIQKYALDDVLSIEEWAQETVPQPVLAVIFLYPISDKQEEFRQSENEKIKTDGQIVDEKVYCLT